MAENKKSFLLYVDVWHTVKKLDDKQAGILFKHILGYVNDENPGLNDFVLEIAFEPIKQSLKRDLKRYESICQRNRDNGVKGGRPKTKPKKPTGLNNNPNNPDKPDSDNDIDNDSVIDNEKKKVKYADFVSMKEIEYSKLISNNGIKNTKIFIDILDNYKGSNGKKYKDDYRAILSWVIDKAKKEGKYNPIHKPTQRAEDMI